MASASSGFHWVLDRRTPANKNLPSPSLITAPHPVPLSDIQAASTFIFTGADCGGFHPCTSFLAINRGLDCFSRWQLRWSQMYQSATRNSPSISSDSDSWSSQYHSSEVHPQAHVLVPHCSSPIVKPV